MRVDDEIDLETEENSSDSEYSDDGLGWHGYDNRSEVISDIGTNKNGCKDPRKYWVEIVKARMHSVVKEWRHIVLTLKTAHQSVRTQCVLSLTDVNTRPGNRPEAPFRIPSPYSRTPGTNFRILVLVEQGLTSYNLHYSSMVSVLENRRQHSLFR